MIVLLEETDSPSAYETEMKLVVNGGLILSLDGDATYHDGQHEVQMTLSFAAAERLHKALGEYLDGLVGK